MRLTFEYLKIVAFALIVCLTSVSVPAQAVGDSQKAFAAANSPISSGILNVADGAEVYVNGNQAQDGMTVLSGAEVETREKSAIVTLNNLGIVRICQQTKINLVFIGERVVIKLVSGNARLELNPGNDGEIKTVAGMNVPADQNGIALTPNYSDTTCGCRSVVAPVVPLAAFPGFLPFLGISGGAVAAAIIGTNLGDDEMPVTAISVVVP